jgi:predicted nucleic acid-binding OB-fold protein
MHRDLNFWPLRSPHESGGGHSTKEIEHRFTDLEAFTRASSVDRLELHEIVEKHGEKLTLHERVLLGLLMALATLLQDRFPALVHLIKGLLGS